MSAKIDREWFIDGYYTLARLWAIESRALFVGFSMGLVTLPTINYYIY